MATLSSLTPAAQPPRAGHGGGAGSGAGRAAPGLRQVRHRHGALQEEGRDQARGVRTQVRHLVLLIPANIYSYLQVQEGLLAEHAARHGPAHVHPLQCPAAAQRGQHRHVPLDCKWILQYTVTDTGTFSKDDFSQGAVN